MASFMIEYDTGSTATWSNVESWEVQNQILVVTFEPGILDRFTMYISPSKWAAFTPDPPPVGPSARARDGEANSGETSLLRDLMVRE
jgi:hypothetical protein